MSFRFILAMLCSYGSLFEEEQEDGARYGSLSKATAPPKRLLSKLLDYVNIFNSVLSYTVQK